MKSILLALLPALLLSNCVGGNRVTRDYLSVQDQKLRTTGSTWYGSAGTANIIRRKFSR
jgi:hypothetical protein